MLYSAKFRAVFVQITLLFSLFVCSTSAQTYSIPTPPTIDSTYAERLEHLCKVWGYVKYFHAGISAASRWDDVLVRALTETKAATNEQEYRAIVDTLIARAGSVTTATTPAPILAQGLDFGNDYSWMRNTKLLSSASIAALERIRSNFRPFASYYIGVSDVSTAQPRNEEAYTTLGVLNEQYRLLALFRYWNIIHYFFPYKDTLDRPWEEAFRRTLPYFVGARNNTEYYGAVLRLAAQINDTHGTIGRGLLAEHWGNGAHPTLFTYINGETVISSIPFSENVLRTTGAELLKIGDVLLTIDNVPTDSIRQRFIPFIAASNEAALQRTVNGLLRYGNPAQTQLWRIRRGADILEVAVQPLGFQALSAGLIQPPQTPVKWRILENNIGYVNMGILTANDIATMMQELKSTRGIIFDVRNYPNFILYDLCRYLTAPTPFVSFTTPNLRYPGTFTQNFPTNVQFPRLSPPTFVGGNDISIRYRGKLAVLMNEQTQSRAEFTCMALQAAGATLVGSQTAGADGNIVQFVLPGNFLATYTSLGIFYPDGRPTQRIGIVPDIVVSPTQAGLVAGRDEVLERAVKHILEEQSTPQNCAENIAAQILPNPSPNLATLRFTSLQSKEVTVHVVNTSGQEVRSVKIFTRSGINTVPIDITTLASGVYYCILQSPDAPCRAVIPLVKSK